MSVEVLDGATILSFVEDEEAFNSSVSERFGRLDSDHDGVLSYGDMVGELKSLTQYGVDPDEVARAYGSLFGQFDHDSNGSVDFEEFKAETKEMMLAMASGLGFLPVQMVLEHDSFLFKAVQRESNKIV